MKEVVLCCCQSQRFDSYLSVVELEGIAQMDERMADCAWG